MALSVGIDELDFSPKVVASAMFAGKQQVIEQRIPVRSYRNPVAVNREVPQGFQVGQILLGYFCAYLVKRCRNLPVVFLPSGTAYEAVECIFLSLGVLVQIHQNPHALGEINDEADFAIVGKLADGLKSKRRDPCWINEGQPQAGRKAVA